MSNFQRVRQFQERIVDAAQKANLSEGVLMNVLMSQSVSQRPIKLTKMDFKVDWKGKKPVIDAMNPDQQFRATRMALMLEEVVELMYAEEAGDIVEVADALGDILVIAYGTAAIYGIDLDKVFATIMDSNETKFNPDGSLPFRVDGKYLKGENYRKPNIKEVLNNA